MILTVKIIFIGTGCGVPSKSRGSPSILVRTEGSRVRKPDLLLFDTGPGSLRKLREAGFTYNDIDYILYTHFHLDHIADLGAFLFASKYPVALRTKKLDIIGSLGLKKFYGNLIRLYGSQIENLSYTLKIIETNDFETPGWKIHSTSLPHTPESVGYRLEDKTGKVFVYSGDTEYCKGIVDLAESADILILECSFPEKTPGHLYPETVARIAREAKVKHLVLTHFYPAWPSSARVCDSSSILSKVKKEFDGKVTIAEDLMHLVID